MIGHLLLLQGSPARREEGGDGKKSVARRDSEKLRLLTDPGE